MYLTESRNQKTGLASVEVVGIPTLYGASYLEIHVRNVLCRVDAAVIQLFPDEAGPLGIELSRLALRLKQHDQTQRTSDATGEAETSEAQSSGDKEVSGDSSDRNRSL